MGAADGSAFGVTPGRALAAAVDISLAPVALVEAIDGGMVVAPEMEAKARGIAATHLDAVARAHAGGVRIAMGTDSGVFAHGSAPRELAWLVRAPFEWGEHVIKGKEEAGLTAEDTERLTIGSSAPGWDELDRAVVKAMEELHAQAMICDETWDVLARHLTDHQLLELPMLAGQYHKVAYVQNSLRVRLRKENPGLSAR